MKYFGTDGIRGRLKKEINAQLLNKIAKAIVLYYKKRNLKKVLLVGNDSRISSDYILSTLASKLLINGIEIHNVGQCSSPCLAFLTQKYNYPLGLMHSASHNPANYNGLKFFNNMAEKVGDAFEEEFELLMDSKSTLKNNTFSIMKNSSALVKTYIEHLKSHIKFDIPVVLDCSNGGTSEICKSLFPKQEKIYCSPNGTNINSNCGCTHIDVIKAHCIKAQKIGFAFDGDGDRVYAVDKDGTILDGDKLLYILSKFYQKPNDICVGTIYTNTGLEMALKNHGVILKRSGVGDKKVYELMTQTKSVLGGEDSGHIIVKPFMNTGDGVLVAILVLNVLSLSKSSFEKLLKDYHSYSQQRANITLPNKSFSSELLQNEEFISLIDKIKQLGARVIVRPSGTEPVLRLFVEDKDSTLAQQNLNILSNFINNYSTKK